MPNLNDAFAWIENLKREIARIKSGAFLENSSITNGIMRFIGGVLRIEAGGLLEGDGTFRWRGLGSIAGDWEVLEGGVLKVGGVLISPIGGGRIMVGAGPNGLILDGGNGSLTNGNVTIEGGKVKAGIGAAQVLIDGSNGTVTVGSGTQQVLIDGATGRIISGALTIDPTVDGGAILFANGTKLYSNATAIGLRNGSTSLTLGELLASLLSGGKSFSVSPDGFNLTGVEEVTSADGVKWLGLKGDKLVLVAPGVGGPGASLTWPFPPSTVTSEYGPREVTIPGASPFHLGIDFGMPGGTPIPAAGAGRVIFAGESGGYGNHVEIDHGGGLVTTYSHMQTAPYVTAGQYVTRGFVLGPVGDTGTSGGNHLHFEVHVNGEPVNPRSKLPAA